MSLFLPTPVVPMLRTLCATAALALAASPAVAGPGCGMGGMAGPPSTLQVQGEGQAQVTPDTAQISLGVTTQAATAAQAMADNAARQTAVIEALGAQGIEARDIQTSGLNLSPLHDYSAEGRPPVITGYQAQNMVSIRVRDIARLGSVLDILVTAGANEVQGITFLREDATATEDEARREAVENARHRAEVLAEAAGMRLGRLLMLGDSGPQPGPMPAMMAVARDMAEKSTPVAPGELTVTAQVGATFQMLPKDAGLDGGHDCSGHGSGHGYGHGHGHGRHMHDHHGASGGQGAPMPHGGPMHGGPMPGGPMEGAPMQGGPMHGTPGMTPPGGPEAAPASTGATAPAAPASPDAAAAPTPAAPDAAAAPAAGAQPQAGVTPSQGAASPEASEGETAPAGN